MRRERRLCSVWRRLFPREASFSEGWRRGSLIAGRQDLLRVKVLHDSRAFWRPHICQCTSRQHVLAAAVDDVCAFWRPLLMTCARFGGRCRSCVCVLKAAVDDVCAFWRQSQARFGSRHGDARFGSRHGGAHFGGRTSRQHVLAAAVDAVSHASVVCAHGWVVHPQANQ